jgi:hypothetical protein
VHNSEIGTFADAGIRISFGHIWLLFVFFFVEHPQPPGHGKVK